MSSSLVLNNSNRHIGRIKPESKDFSFSDLIGTIKRIRLNLESSSVATTLQKTRIEEIEKIINEKESLIDKRNVVLNNPIKYILPFYKKQIHKIDAKIDALDLQLYLLETEDTIKKPELDNIISTAEERLEKYAKYLNSK
jgi:hypothetical protein